MPIPSGAGLDGCAARAPDAATDAPSTVCGSVLVAVAVFGVADGGGGTAGRLPGIAHRTHFRSRAQSQLALARNAVVQGADSPATTVDLQQFVPSHFHNPWTGGGFRVGGGHHSEGNFRLCRHLPGELCRVRHDHRSAQRALQLHPAALGGVLSAAYDRHPDFHHRERHRASAVRHVERAGGIPPAILYPCFHRVRGCAAGRETGLGSAAVRALYYFFGRTASGTGFATPRAEARTSWPTFRTFCTRPSPATAS